MPINVFGEGAVQTAYVAYRNVTLNANTTMFWPNAYQDTPDVMAAYMRIGTTGSAGLILTLPNATQVSVGQNFIITNTSLNSFNIANAAGGDLGAVDVGISYYYILQDNSTAAGSWIRLTYGAGVADVDAAELAGLGLAASLGKLNTSIPVVSTIGPYAVTSAQSASLIVWTGGSGNLTLPNVADVPNGFYFSFNNEGSGEVVILGDSPIDNALTFIVEPSQSLTLVKGTNNWWSIGFGQQTFFAVNVLNKNVGGNTNVTLSTSESARNIQQYSGVLTGDIKVYFPVQANEWTVFNNTTGAFTLTVQLVGNVGTAYIVPQGNTQIFYSDGTTLRIAPSILSPNAVTFPDGTAGAPGLAFTNSLNTGVYLPTAGVLGLTAGGSAGLNLSSTALNINKATTISNTLTANSLTLSTTALSISNGGTGQTTAAAALNALMPSGVATGAIVYYNGTNWVQLAAGADGSKLTLVGGIPAWVP